MQNMCIVWFLLQVVSCLSCQLGHDDEPKYYSIGFGGLDLCKAFVNILRNYNLQNNGEYFGTNILIALKEKSPLLQQLKNAVFVGKDRQSDYLAYLTVGEEIQTALWEQENLCIQRVPEKFLS